ncbi:MAG: hypothetical protein J6P79_10280 [Pseudobutyrivibrio sp.]|nr:hypothetical protein [Pseudobutyrivibrio sp.]
MNTSKVIHQAKLNDWANTIREQQANSLNVTEWCQSNGIAKAQFYYWKRKLKDQFVEAQLPDIVPLNTPVAQQCCTTNTTFEKLSTLKLSIGSITIEITEDTSDYLLAKVL